MAAAQALYEQGHITYHRTDNPNISDSDIPMIRLEAEKMGLVITEQRRRWPVKDGTQAGHPAITPTHWEVMSAGETEAQQSVYDMIRRRSIASQLPDARYAVRVAILSGMAPDSTPLTFVARGRVLTDQGWMKLPSLKDEEADEEAQGEDTNAVPHLTVGEQVTVSQGNLVISETKPPKHYTEASLIKKSEAEGIGRPSTYASIMSTILKREYAKVRQKMLAPTEKGFAVVDMLAGRFGFMDIDFTRRVEAAFDLIANGQQLYKPTVTAFYETLEAELLALAIAVPVQPSENMILAVQSKAKREGLIIPDGVLASADSCRSFLGPRDNGDNRLSRMASEKQIALIRRYIDAGKMSAPNGFPDNLVASVASKAIETVINQSKRN